MFSPDWLKAAGLAPTHIYRNLLSSTSAAHSLALYSSFVEQKPHGDDKTPLCEENKLDINDV